MNEKKSKEHEPEWQRRFMKRFERRMIQKKRVIGIICSIALIASMTGCVAGDAQNEIKSGTVKYDIFLNTGSCFVYTFQDPETGVWYVSTSEGVTERLNPDGSLYVK